MGNIEFISRLREVIGEFAEGKYSNFAKEAKIAIPTFQKYLLGESLPGFRVIQKMCNYTGVSADWLILGQPPKYRVRKVDMESLVAPSLKVILDGDLPNIDVQELASANYSLLPILDTTNVSMPLKFCGNDVSEYALVPKEKAEDCHVLFRINNNLMAPVLQQGDIVAVKLNEPEIGSLHNRIVAVREGTDITFQRLCLAKKYCVFHPDDMEHSQPIILPLNKASDVLVGSVRWCWKSL